MFYWPKEKQIFDDNDLQNELELSGTSAYIL